MANLADDARLIFEGGLRAVQPDILLRTFDLHSITRRDLGSYEHVSVLGMGKAALAMVSVLEERLGDRIDDGYAVTPNGYSRSLPEQYRRPQRIELGEGGHPLPDSGSRAAAAHILGIAEKANSDDLIIVLLSGGGSAVCTDFFDDITLEDARKTFQLLLRAGLDIYAINTVRKHMSLIGGGRLALKIHPAEVVALVISDVVGDDLSIIASGPTTGDPTSFADAVSVLESANLWETVPASVQAFLCRGLENGKDESPKPGDSIFGRVVNHLLATNEMALRGAAEVAGRLGYETRMIDGAVTGEASEAGRRLAEEAMHSRRTERTCFLAGGETSVTVRGEGRGGRNQELALSAALALSKSTDAAVFLSAGTDGIDGPTEVAGAVVTNSTVAEAREKGIDPITYLQTNNSYGFFEEVGGFVRTGPTHTNVMDVQVILI